MAIMKKYVIKCHSCGKEIILDVKLSKISHMTFVDDLIVNKTSKCKCLKTGTSITNLQLLFRQLVNINNNKDYIAKELEKQG